MLSFTVLIVISAPAGGSPDWFRWVRGYRRIGPQRFSR
jgi:hypothetical protein